VYNLQIAKKYDILKNKWEAVQNLKEPRYYCASFTMNKNFIYAFGGQSNHKGCLNSLERINLNELKFWEFVIVNGVCPARQQIQGIQIKLNEAIIFGGSQYDSYILKINKTAASCELASNLPSAPGFYNTTAPICNGSCVYAVDINRQVREYTIHSNKWTKK
jgi:hypothetical protein